MFARHLLEGELIPSANAKINGEAIIPYTGEGVTFDASIPACVTLKMKEYCVPTKIELSFNGSLQTSPQYVRILSHVGESGGWVTVCSSFLPRDGVYLNR